MGFLRRRKNKNFGAFLLEEAAAGDPVAKEWLERRYAEGVTDDDLIAFYGYSDKRRRETMQSYLNFMMTIYERYRSEGASEEEASEQARRDFPNFTQAEDIYVETNLTGEDRPLPGELEPRVAAWVERNGPRMLSEAHMGERKLARTGYSSVNARLRAEMAKGNL